MSFAEALPHFADGSLDFIYIDGYAHTGQESGGTLRDWWPKLRAGGVFAGHDYCARYQPTCDAVDAFVAANGLTLHVTETGGDSFPSWWVIKPVIPDVPTWLLAGDVCLVGNGPSVLGRGLGCVIDAYPEVIRFNRFRLRGFETDVGNKTTIWSTFGHGYLPGDDDVRPERVLFVYGERGDPAYPPRELRRIPKSFYNATKERMLAFSDRDAAAKAGTGMSSGFMVIVYLLDVLRVPRVSLVGFDHFSKKNSGQHHYYNPKLYSAPPDLDGAAEAAALADYVAAGRVRYL